jgi:nicotinate-nucleotide pyrophosphorylase (carboxylating)
MISKEQFEKEIELIITNGIREDVGTGDYSSLACIPESATGGAKLLVKDNGVIAGVALAERIFKHLDKSIQFNLYKSDGETVVYGDVVFEVFGSSQTILKGERLVLNAMQRMSAIATKTAEYVKLLEGTGTKILDTRKTTPGIRALEKWAVVIGGGENHRFALYDMVMLKDNHIDFAGGLHQAIDKTTSYLKQHDLDLKIIVEARDLYEVSEILKHHNIHRILLDNFSLEDTRKAVEMVGNQTKTESSGGINEENMRAYAECGVNYISSGALTHSIYNLDLSLKAI